MRDSLGAQGDEPLGKAPSRGQRVCVWGGGLGGYSLGHPLRVSSWKCQL